MLEHSPSCYSLFITLLVTLLSFALTLSIAWSTYYVVRSEHKYNCTSNSILDKVLQVWWCWLVSKTPLYIAPNLLTIVGLFVNILTSLVLIWYSPDAKAEAPRWCYLACAVGLFVYQSLDAIGEFSRILGMFIRKIDDKSLIRWQTSQKNKHFLAAGWTFWSRVSSISSWEAPSSNSFQFSIAATVFPPSSSVCLHVVLPVWVTIQQRCSWTVQSL